MKAQQAAASSLLYFISWNMKYTQIINGIIIIIENKQIGTAYCVNSLFTLHSASTAYTPGASETSILKRHKYLESIVLHKREKEKFHRNGAKEKMGNRSEQFEFKFIEN